MSKMPNTADAALVFSALGDDTRLSLVRKLVGGASLSATSLTSGSRVTRQAVMKHLKVLEDAGLVRHHKEGREVLYVLEHKRVDDARAFLDGISAGWDRAIARLKTLVEK